MQSEASSQMAEVKNQVGEVMEQLAQKDTQIHSLQEELETLQLQHSAVLKEMASGAHLATPKSTGSRALPIERLREDNCQMQKQLGALKNELHAKDRKIKGIEKQYEIKTKDVEKLNLKINLGLPGGDKRKSEVGTFWTWVAHHQVISRNTS